MKIKASSFCFSLGLTIMFLGIVPSILFSTVAFAGFEGFSFLSSCSLLLLMIGSSFVVLGQVADLFKKRKKKNSLSSG